MTNRKLDRIVPVRVPTTTFHEIRTVMAKFAAHSESEPHRTTSAFVRDALQYVVEQVRVLTGNKRNKTAIQLN